ncbi:MAG: zinc-binding dehydrogenase [Chthoniobacterales bacterium]|nr:zinc-binding dehydrogenase [Chthoniobacterales bacterium]
MKTPAAILVEQRHPLVVDEVDVPALKRGQVLVEIHASRICGSQIGEIDGVKGPDRFLPHLLGHEAGAVVLEVGPEVTQVEAGDRVVCHWRPGAGIDGGGAVYKWDGRDVNAGPITTFQRFAVISENRLTKVPPETDFELCCLLADTLTTGFGIINNDARVRAGESVVIFGVGGIGLGVVLGAKLAGANPIIAVDLHDHKLAKAADYGATHAIHAGREQAGERVREILGGLADVTIDGTGNPKVIETAYDLAKLRGGRCVLFGVMPSDQRVSIHTLPLHFGRMLTGSEGGQSRPHEDIPRILGQLADAAIDWRGFISHRGGLDDANGLIERMRSGEVVHAVMTIRKNSGI